MEAARLNLGVAQYGSSCLIRGDQKDAVGVLMDGLLLAQPTKELVRALARAWLEEVAQRLLGQRSLYGLSARHANLRLSAATLTPCCGNDYNPTDGSCGTKRVKVPRRASNPCQCRSRPGDHWRLLPRASRSRRATVVASLMAPADLPGRGKVVLVSGGSGGIGAEISSQLHQDGWTVVIGYVSKERAELLASDLNTKASPALAVHLDMSRPASVSEGVGWVIDKFDHLDAAVFNGGVAATVAFLDTEEDQWWWEVQVNLLGPMLVTKLCLPGMLKAGSGVFVGITSDAAKVGDAHHSAVRGRQSGDGRLLQEARL